MTGSTPIHASNRYLLNFMVFFWWIDLKSLSILARREVWVYSRASIPAQAFRRTSRVEISG